MNEGLHLLSGQFVWIKKVGADDAGEPLRQFLREKMNLSRAAVTAIKRDGHLEVNGLPVTVRRVIEENDQVTVTFPKEQESAGLLAEPVPYSIVYEDDAFMVINKPAGLQTVPSRKDWKRSLAGGVLFYLKQHGVEATAHMVTRLDRDTSGLILVAKHGFFHEMFTKMRKAHRLSREYIAIVHGHLDTHEGVIDAPIGRKEESIIERCVRSDGRPAITHYKVIKETEAFSVVAVRLETGRTHQIRVHFSHIGHPLVGDDLYGGSREAISRQALHASRLFLYHPVTEEAMTFTAPLPEDMKRLVEH